MKTYFWITGVPCSGKSYFAEKLAAKLNIPFVHLDCVFDEKPQLQSDFITAYQNLLPDAPFIVIDGIAMFSRNIDLAALRIVLGDARIIHIIMNVQLRKKEVSMFALSRNDYETEIIKYKLRAGRHIEIKTTNDLNYITDEDLRSIAYQHEGFTNLKWKQLNIDTAGKTVLDLGCSSCFYEKYANEQGATAYTGLDCNMAYLFNENAHHFDLNYLEQWRKPADIVISTSVFHYIGDKEKFIRECARLTRETFVFETPLSRLPGRVLECEPNRNLLFPSKSLLEYWLGKYFNLGECFGECITEDNSYRLIYHCKK